MSRGIGHRRALWVKSGRQVAVFKPISRKLLVFLVGFVHQKNVGKSVEFGGKVYTLDRISVSDARFSRDGQRRLSIYFRVNRSVVRISDHWSASNGRPRSGKLNCGPIGPAWWEIDNDDPATVEVSYRAGKYPWQVFGGVCGLNVLNQTVEHWKG